MDRIATHENVSVSINGCCMNNPGQRNEDIQVCLARTERVLKIKKNVLTIDCQELHKESCDEFMDWISLKGLQYSYAFVRRTQEEIQQVDVYIMSIEQIKWYKWIYSNMASPYLNKYLASEYLIGCTGIFGNLPSDLGMLWIPAEKNVIRQLFANQT